MNEIFIVQDLQGSIDYLTTYIENPSIFVMGYFVISSLILLFNERINTVFFSISSALSFLGFYLSDDIFLALGADDYGIAFTVFLPILLLHFVRWVRVKKSSLSQKAHMLGCVILMLFTIVAGTLGEGSITHKEEKTYVKTYESLLYTYLKNDHFTSFIEFCEVNEVSCITSKSELLTEKEMNHKRILLTSIKSNISEAKKAGNIEILSKTERTPSNDYFSYTWVRDVETMKYMLLYDDKSEKNRQFLHSYIYWTISFFGYMFVMIIICMAACTQGLKATLREINSDQ